MPPKRRAKASQEKADTHAPAPRPALAPLPALPPPPIPRSSTVDDDLTDVYSVDTDGRRKAIPEHEQRLEDEAHRYANSLHIQYTDQIDIARIRYPEKIKGRVFFVVDRQKFRTLYTKNFGHVGFEDVQGAEIPEFSYPGHNRFPKGGVDKSALIRCSALAAEHFAFNPDSDELHLPIRYPRMHIAVPNAKYAYRNWWDSEMAYLHPGMIEAAITPWLTEIENWWEDDTEQPEESIPLLTIPDTLEDKIHLYNIMVQLAAPKFLYSELTKALVEQMDQSKLAESHLDLLEMTVGRLNAGTVSILDPVLNHLVATYASRDKATDIDVVRRPGPQDPAVPGEPLNPLKYGVKNAGRSDYPRDTVIVPPKYPVIGHCIKNWPEVRGSNGDARAAHVRYPLNVGRERKFWRRNSTDPILGKRSADAISADDAGTVVDYTERSGST
ncbi:hypothetical protein K504DRAFT_516863 [Pleomassaria siparia CBS 279.74]|uniref:Uncharacterized protein n=1 Tax=Pleomassaria siparia CBS 279.74 TaxID=1314801 RepID=A0A6G1KJM1_9PLEO|nr:hypothetical protein K504DRAFT_516863 [Pleomassaria siparia CBS 279.74]